LLLFLNFFLSFEVLCVSTNSFSCEDWIQYKNEKCIKIFDKEKLVSFNEAEKTCFNLGYGSSILTIHSKKEQEFISQFLFETNKIVDNVWIGLIRNDNQFEWKDGSEIDFTFWAEENPTNKPDHDCVQMIPDSSPMGQWADQSCNKKNLIVCQKAQNMTLSFLRKIQLEMMKELKETKESLSDNRKKLRETQNQLEETQENLNKIQKQPNESQESLTEAQKQLNHINYTLSTHLENLLSNEWINYKLFTDTDGKHKALFIPFFEISKLHTWEAANNICAKFNATLVEIRSLEKKFIFELFLSQLGMKSKNLNVFWLNGRKDSTGKWKWITSGEEINFLLWSSSLSLSYSDNHYVKIYFDNSNKLDHSLNKMGCFVACEVDVNF
jgi:hypothetical protein